MIGTRLRDRFVIERALGGEAGRLRWAARDERGRAEVEVWTLPAVREPARWAAAMAKARAVPGLRRVIEHGTDGGAAWVAYAAAQPGPRVEGGRPMAIEHVIGWARAVAAGLEGAQRAGSIHGALVVDDVVMVGSELRIGGLGVWGEVDAAAMMVAWGDEVWQLAPEVRAGGAATAATDVWSLALGAARLAFGEARDGDDVIARARASGASIGELIEAALADDPARRPTAGGFVEVLVRIARMTGTESVTGADSGSRSDPGSGSDSATVIGPPPTASAPPPPPTARMVAVSHSAELARPRTAQLPIVEAEDEPVRPRVQMRSISDAIPTAFSTKQGALGYMAPPASARAPQVEPARRPLVIVATALIVVLIAIAATVAFTR